MKKPDNFVVAVQLDLDTPGFAYQKWGELQFCKRGDWLVCNQGDTYTIDGKTFDRTYRQSSPGVFVKTTPVWAERATQEGSIPTKEGATRYQAGDFLVYNEKDGGDGYAVSAATFQEMYEPFPEE